MNKQSKIHAKSEYQAKQFNLYNSMFIQFNLYKFV